MSTVIRRKRASRINIGPYKRHELLTGSIFYPARGYSGYGDGSSTDVTDFITDEMLEDWRRNRADLIAFWLSGEYTNEETFSDSKPWLFVCGRPGELPWAARVLDQL